MKHTEILVEKSLKIMGLVNDKRACPVSLGKRCKDVRFLALKKAGGEELFEALAAFEIN